MREQAVVVIAAVKGDDRAGIEAQPAGDVALMHPAFGYVGEAGQVAFMIEQQWSLIAPLVRRYLRPVEHVGAEIDDAGIEAEQLVLEAELAPAGRRQAGQRANNWENTVVVQLPRPVLVGVGQRRFRWAPRSTPGD